MSGIGTAAKNWKDELEQQQGIGTPAYHEPAGSISTPAQNQGIGTPAYHEPAGSIGTPASKDGTMKAVDPMRISAQPGAQQPTTQQKPMQVMEGVTAGTQQKLNQLDKGYQPGSAAQQAMQQLQQMQSQKPGGYNSQYAAQIDSILAEINGQKPFQYSVNQDALFQSLSDYYTQQAKQASLNAQGQAAGLTGGYGNSAAQAAGSQAYQQALLPLYDKAMDTARFAYDVYQGNQADRLNRLQALQSMDATAYARNRDELGDWEREREYQTGRYDTEANRDMQAYYNDLDYALKRAQIENADYRSEQERQEAIRQFEMNYAADQARFGWQQQVDQRDYDRNVMESDRNYGLQREQFDYGKQQDAQQQANWQAQFDYGKQQDALAQQNWQAQFDRGVLESDRNYQLNQQQMDEQIRQFNESLNWDKMNADQKYAADIVLQTLAMGQMPSDELLARAGLTAEDAGKMKARVSSGGAGGGTKTYYTDGQGNFYNIDAKGNRTKVDPKNIKPTDLIDSSKAVNLTNQNVTDSVNAVKAAIKKNKGN